MVLFFQVIIICILLNTNHILSLMSTHPDYEIERAFIVHQPPADYQHHPWNEIEQGYYTDPGSGTFTRVRRKGAKYIQTVKKGSGLVRQETERETTQEEFYTTWPMTEGWRLEKVRYELPYGTYTIELDIYKGSLHPLITAEVEFESVEASRTFTPPSWMGKEVTEDRRYTNAHLAKHGLPDNHPSASDL